MRYNTCPTHPGQIIENHPCLKCGHPQALPEGRPPYRSPYVVPSKEEEIMDDTATLTKPPADPETGEVFTQPTLDETIFPATRRQQVPMIKVGFSGQVEMSEATFREYCNQGLQPGRVVQVTLSGYLPNPHPKWVKRTEGTGDDKETWWEQEGQVKVKALDLGSFELKGMYHGE